MSMRRCAISDPLSDDQRALDSEVTHYLCDVLRLRHNDRFVGFDGKGMERIFRLNCEGEVTIAEGVGEIYQGRQGAPVGLCFAIPKGDKLDLVARQITELGVAELHLWSAERSVGVWKQQKGKQKLARLERVTREASRQSGRADELMIYLPARLQDLVIRHQHVPLRLFLDPKADHGWSTLESSAQTADLSSLEQTSRERDLNLHDQTDLVCVLIVGPEGGISPSERDQLCEAGWRGVRLASPVLRTETAGVVACALALDRLGYLA